MKTKKFLTKFGIFGPRKPKVFAESEDFCLLNFMEDLK